MSQEFEQRIASFLGVKHCVAMCNGTIALEIATRALDLKGEVIVPSYTFIATAHALQWQEITPIFADIDPATHNLDPAAVWRMITPRTTGIIGVHLWGRPSPVQGTRGYRQGTQAAPDVRRVARLRLQPGRQAARRFRRVRGVQLSRDKVLQHVRRRRRRHEQRRARREDAPDAQLRFLGLRQRDLSRHQRQDDRDLRGDGTHEPGRPGRIRRAEPAQLSLLTATRSRRSPG